jgi:hypothetical protein
MVLSSDLKQCARQGYQLDQRILERMVWWNVEGAAPSMFVVAVVCGAVALCSSGYGKLGRAALQLEVERCYIGGNGPGRCCRLSVQGMLGRCGCQGSDPESFATSRECDLVLCGQRGCLWCWSSVCRWKNWHSLLWSACFFTFVKESESAPPIAMMAYSLR